LKKNNVLIYMNSSTDRISDSYDLILNCLIKSMLKYGNALSIA
jgi:hypothetical protein